MGLSYQWRQRAEWGAGASAPIPAASAHDHLAPTLMTAPEPLIRNISDTAMWVAVYRARESERPDAVFHDPYARRLAGERGEQIATSLKFSEKNAWSFIARTWIIDKLITEQVAEGVDLVVNLAAGLDSRPYRLPLPASLRWVEVDLPPLITYKETVLRGEQPACSLERVPLDLADRAGRAKLFTRLGGSSRRALIVAEGLLIYLTEDEVGSLAADLAAQPSFQRWIIDFTSPPLLKMLQQNMTALAQAGSPFKFAPAEGPAFFERFGWKPLASHSFFHTAARLRRLRFFMRLLAKVLADEAPNPKQPWGGIVLLGKP
jgi:methyltransferase (TIGR00027 family)